MTHPNTNPSIGIVLLVHGTRNARAQVEIHAALSQLCQQLARFKNLPQEAVIYSFLEAMDPLLSAALTQLVTYGKTQIEIVPLLLFPGTHYYEDIPAAAEAVMAAHPDVIIHTRPYIGVSDIEFMQLVDKRLSPEAISV